MKRNLGSKFIFLLLTFAAVHTYADKGKKVYVGGGEIGSANDSTQTSDHPGMSKAEFATYMANCKKTWLESDPKKDSKDVEMLCRDPYLNGKPNESKSDRARRERLIQETDEAKESFLDKAFKIKGPKKPSLTNCKKALIDADPAKDPKDAEMLCSNPYLEAKPNESYEDQVRRKRLIQEAEKSKENALDKYVVPRPPSTKRGTQ